MAVVARVWSGVALLVVLALVPLATAQSEQLQAAIDLYEQQEYRAAQDALLKIERSGLTDAERGTLEELLTLLPQAIAGSDQAARDMAEADAAFEAGDWDKAERLYTAVGQNSHARAAARTTAAAQLQRIVEKKKLPEAPRSNGPVVTSGDPQVVIATDPTPQSPSTPAPATPAQAAPQTAPPPTPAEEPVGPRPLTPTDELRMRDELLWQRAVAMAESLSAEARAAMADSDFITARQRVAAALQAIESAAHYAEPVSKYETSRAGVLALQREMELAADDHARLTADRQRQEIRDQIERRKLQIEQQKAEKIIQLFNSVEQLRRERRYGEAAEVLREILRIDPGNAEARYQLNWAEDLESFDRQSRWQADVDSQTRRALENAEDALIPWDVDVMYPQNWLELTAQRAKQGISTGRDIGDVELNRQLSAALPDVRFEETPLEQVMDFLTDVTKINISVDWTDLADNGIERDKAVTVQLSNVTFRAVLNEVLAQAGGDTRLAFAIGDGLLRIATKDKLDRDKLVLIYDIRDLLISLPRAQRQGRFDVTQGLGQNTGVGGGGGGGGAASGMFGQGQGGQYNQQQDQQNQDNTALTQQIIDIIRQTVEPDSWRETGGGDGSIRDLNGQLIIYNTSDAHRQVADLLSQLRETRALQISVESRLLSVTSNFLEEFGVDLDFVFNAGNAGFDQAQGATGVLTDPATGAIVLIPRDYSRMGVLPATPAFGVPLTAGTVPQQPYSSAGLVPAEGGMIPSSHYFTPISAQQNSVSLAKPNVATGVPGTFASQAGLTPALSIAGSFLDNLQVDFLIRATQANSRSSIVQAPRIVIFNGQASRIDVGKARTYVASLEPRLAEAAVGFAPETNVASSGVGMYVEGTISADRRYVTLTLSLESREDPTFERFETQRASGNSPGAFIELPTETFTTIQTTVSIPDGGTVLMGGLKQVGEVEVEAGVPVLSKIPVLKRAFTNQTTVKDTRTLLILVKAKIIIQKEAEDEAFPTFSQGAGI
ncbi:MAG: hypothetical protein KA383_10760 [Phycisphaerae bacterium]|nr:hypothetical protein [Phycisphaerae bacterium]